MFESENTHFNIVFEDETVTVFIGTSYLSANGYVLILVEVENKTYNVLTHEIYTYKTLKDAQTQYDYLRDIYPSNDKNY